jgi:hypothetical protein
MGPLRTIGFRAARAPENLKQNPGGQVCSQRCPRCPDGVSDRPKIQPDEVSKLGTYLVESEAGFLKMGCRSSL